MFRIIPFPIFFIWKYCKRSWELNTQFSNNQIYLMANIWRSAKPFFITATLASWTRWKKNNEPIRTLFTKYHPIKSVNLNLRPLRSEQTDHPTWKIPKSDEMLNRFAFKMFKNSTFFKKKRKIKSDEVGWKFVPEFSSDFIQQNMYKSDVGSVWYIISSDFS